MTGRTLASKYSAKNTAGVQPLMVRRDNGLRQPLFGIAPLAFVMVRILACFVIRRSSLIAVFGLLLRVTRFPLVMVRVLACFIIRGSASIAVGGARSLRRA